MANANAVVRARISEDIKDEAAAVLAELGLSLSDLIRMTITRVARDRAVPFDLKLPNARTVAAVEEADLLLKQREGRFDTAKDVVDALDGPAEPKAG